MDFEHQEDLHQLANVRKESLKLELCWRSLGDTYEKNGGSNKVYSTSTLYKIQIKTKGCGEVYLRCCYSQSSHANIETNLWDWGKVYSIVEYEYKWVSIHSSPY